MSTGETTTLLTPWADKKVGKRAIKSHNWRVHPISNSRYQVTDFEYNEIVDLEQWTCSCLKWQLSGLPCGHIINVLKFLKHEDCSPMAIPYFHASVHRQTYAEEINPLPTRNEWHDPGNLMYVRPPIMNKRQPGRPKNCDRIPSVGEGPINKVCSRCLQKGHTRRRCTAFAPAPTEQSTRKSGNRSNKTTTNNTGTSSALGSGSQSQTQNVYPTYNLNSQS